MRANMNNVNVHIGSSLDSLLCDDGILDAVNETVHARVEAWLLCASDTEQALAVETDAIFKGGKLGEAGDPS
ncbi:hypothetical protein SHINM1_005550 [Fluviibacter phosphoraccumulans]|jgi:hypothetical protein|nr:hypothetical protein SHINM1_005550 [Fluviibacter phosphoraccumulans]